MSTPAFVTTPPPDLNGWLNLFDTAILPVLAETAPAVEAWRVNEDAVDAHLLADTIGQDPLMTLKLLTHVAQLRRRGDSADSRGAETVTEALVLLGIGPFFRNFGPQATVDDWLAGQGEALDGLNKVLRRSRRAASFAIGFAVHRRDPDAHLIHEAALLHDFADMLLWLRAPALALAMARRQQAEPGLRSAQVQRETLRVTLPDLQHALMLRWRLPPMLVRITDDAHTADPRVQCVQLAIRLARHTAGGWDNAALPDDLHDIGSLLQLGPDPTRRLLHDIDG